MALTREWRGRRVLITGHTGFRGAWLSLWLQELGAEVFGLALPPPTDPNLFLRAEVAKGMRHHHGDVRDLDRVVEVFEIARPQTVFHLAAQSLVRVSYHEPAETFATNVMGVVNVLEAARRFRMQHGSMLEVAVVVTSDKCYENDGRAVGYREGDRLGGHDPYSSSKACAELVVAAYRRSYGASCRRPRQPAPET